MSPPSNYNLIEPWGRQPFDGDLDWALFQDYLTLSCRPRDVRALVRLGAPLQVHQLEYLAWEKGWVARSHLWDLHLEGKRREAIESEIQENARTVAKRHGRIAKKSLALAEKELDKYLKAVERGDMPGLLTPRDIARLLFLGVKVERLVMGEATDHIEATVDLSSLSLDDLRALKEIQTKAGLA